MKKMIKWLFGGEVRNDCKFYLAHPVRMGFDDSVRLFLRAYCCGDIVATPLGGQQGFVIGVHTTYIYEDPKYMGGDETISAGQ
jgi:hypothetical protein